MRLAHCSDLHLGFRTFDRLTANGQNRREQDVADAWSAAVDGIAAAGVDLILIAGDVFHYGRPGNFAIADAMRGILALRRALPNAPVLIVEGNHDVPRLQAGSPLATLELLGAHVFLRASRASFGDMHVLCVPDRDIGHVALEPGPEEGTHLLLAHGSIGGRLAKLPGVDVLPAEAISPRFAYAGLGDYHTVEQVAPNAWYSGSLEFTSSDPWREIGTPKGWLLVDTVAGTVELQPVPTRRYIDLPALSAHELEAADLTAQLLAAVASIDSDGAVVRQVVTDCLRGTEQAIDRKAIRKATATTLHYQLDVRRPKEIRAGIHVPRFEPAPPDGWASWDAYDSWARDEEAPTGDDAEATPLADQILSGQMPTPAQLAVADPYHLDEFLSRRSAAA